ncbi:glycosyltransferase family 4 protein, partial [Candidatus Sumerlaeota bacterium]|nr:glycosyltransferase family 4 protein [Candidatus Sumerlaeota bacterium]
LDNLPETMASLDIGVVASVGSEGSSRVTMEYMASGVPVVATRVGGIPEILRANERGEAELGVLVPPRDPEALAAAIMGLIENEVERCRLAQAGLRAVRESHDPEKWAEAIERIYYEVLEERE